MRGGWVYIMTNKPFGTLYIGVTSDLAARVCQHRAGKGSVFCKRYGLTQLVYAEECATIYEAIVREKAMKAWNRNWKLRQIIDLNPDRDDLFDRINN
jgi:putative endonuclease